MLPLRPGILDCTALWIRKKDGVLCCQGRAPLQTETRPRGQARFSSNIAIFAFAAHENRPKHDKIKIHRFVPLPSVGLKNGADTYPFRFYVFFRNRTSRLSP